jgi:hypothetical protein
VTEQVEVRFGGSTTGLDNASHKAQQDIKGVGKTAEGLKGTFSAIGQSFKNMFSGTNFGDVSTKMRTIRSSMKEMVEGASHGNIQMGILGRTFAEAASHAAPLAAALLGVAVALGALYTVKRILAFGEAMGEAAEDIEKMSQRLGMSAQEAQKWNAVGAQVHMSNQQMSSGFTRLERSMFMAANGGKQQAAVFKEMKISVNDLKSPTEAVLAIADRFKDMPDGPKKTAMAMQLMGRTGAQMIPILNEGSEGLREMMKVADETGSVMSDQLVGAGLAVDEQFDTMHLATQGLKNILFEALAPAIHAVVSALVDMMKGMIASYRAGGTVYIIVKTLAAGFKVLASVVVAVGGVFAAFAHVAVAAITAVFGPVYTLGAALADIASGNFKGAVQDIKNGARDIGSSVTNSLAQAMGSIKGTGHALAGIWSNALPEGKIKHVKDEMTDMDLDGGAMKYGGGGKKKKDKKEKDTAKKEAEEKLRAYLQELDAEQDAAKEDFEKKMAIEEEKLAAIKKVYGADSKEYKAELRNKQKMELEHAKELDEIQKQRIEHQRALAESTANSDKELADIRLQTEKDRLDAEENLGHISAGRKEQELLKVQQQETADEVDHENTIFEIKANAMREQLQLQNLPLSEQRRINQDLEQLELDHQNKMKVIVAKGTQQAIKQQQTIYAASVTKFKNMLEPISSGFTSMLQGMYNRTMTWKQGLLGIADNLVNSWIQKGVEWATQWAAQELAKTAATTAGNAMRSITATAAATSAATTAAGGHGPSNHQRGSWRVGCLRGHRPHPVCRPRARPRCGSSGAGSHFGLWRDDRLGQRRLRHPGGVNPLTQLHEKEMVLPAHIAEPLRASLKGAGPRMQSPLSAMSNASASQMRSDAALRGPGGDVNLHYGPSYGGQQTHDLDSMLQRDGHRLIRYLRKAKRDGKF